jgi:hypothetical protein
MGLIAGYPPQRPEFDPRSYYVGFMVYKMKLGQVSSEHLSFHRHSSSVFSGGKGANTMGSKVASVPNGLKSHSTTRNNNKKGRTNAAFITCEYLGKGQSYS